MGKKLSILMLTFNRLFYTKQALSAHLKNVGMPFEMVIYDNGSVDGTAEFLASLKHPSLHVIYGDRNIGMAPGLNEALKQSSGEFIIKTDNDLIPPKDYGRILLDAYQIGWKWKKIAWVNPIIQDEVPWKLPHIRIGKYQFLQGPPVAGACGIISRSLLRSIGNFRPGPCNYGAVDGSIMARLKAKGFKVCWLRNLTVIHLEHEDRGRYQKYWDWKLSIVHKRNPTKDFNWAKRMR